MAYSGTTAATTLRNPWRHMGGGGLYGPSNAASTLSSGLVVAANMDVPNGQGANFWSLCSTNLTTDFNAGSAKTVTDGYTLGMRPGDVCFAVQVTSNGSSGLLSIHVVSVANSTAGTCTLSSAFISST